jgi:hypothetical protein
MDYTIHTVCARTRPHAPMRTHACAHMHAHVHVHTHMCAHVHAHVHAHIHTTLQIQYLGNDTHQTDVENHVNVVDTDDNVITGIKMCASH